MSTEDAGVPRTVTVASLVELLSPTLGVDKSTKLLTAVAARLGYGSQSRFTRTEALAMLRSLGSHDGLVGVVARFAATRVSSQSLPIAAEVLPPSPSYIPPSERERTTPTMTMTSYDLEDILAPTLGADRAHDLLEGTMRRLSLGPGPYVRDEALALIDGIAASDSSEESIVSVAARFARARVLLNLK